MAHFRNSLLNSITQCVFDNIARTLGLDRDPELVGAPFYRGPPGAQHLPPMARVARFGTREEIIAFLAGVRAAAEEERWARYNGTGPGSITFRIWIRPGNSKAAHSSQPRAAAPYEPASSGVIGWDDAAAYPTTDSLTPAEFFASQFPPASVNIADIVGKAAFLGTPASDFPEAGDAALG